MTDRSDADLLQAHVEGDPDAFGELFARHRDRLWAVALRTMGNPEDAADGLQDAMVAAFRRAGSFRGDAAVTTWLHRVVVNACLDRIRAAKVRRTEAMRDDVDDRGTLVATATADADPEAAAIAASRRERVLAALASLPADQRAALVLVDMEGYSVNEAAEVLECAPGTVKSRCFRGRARLAALLNDLRGNEGERHHGNPPDSSGVPSSAPPRGPPAP
ncbi:MAG: RNA polymerase sigma factor SigM [Nocardioides sp.]|nr:RNA polymerase sigma factor SigM [Nocardioides sp.]